MLAACDFYSWAALVVIVGFGTWQATWTFINTKYDLSPKKKGDG